ncbi:16S rRNA (guanine(966)-N(2))-methyltransferase RsmD [Malaciobacter molluscorum LMG 25693]|uniref:16S rRNA (Guanine(966)-N(2))-methyltransferase RsmD n=1 Tax=Malaciobacter molluscorum LMG 25693 TaxID=870501 RepID=A0A2G1DEU1_9BACT|nr:16S rRNA (guanine(966)-N(2))-methyltransferase RsmD [Malaciobacter molluscorum]AXX92788.1 RNA methyltransferase, RsmD family [Malaciobacter molluscorum LMG 25693]PHO17018.1 16S rRNA (guanine(966)-N(2))-methyltransferase RsmD [Malaciobacter molluscorum LMG 25693]RXJ96117.1 16S rRNA (guanine(966)-N(2))-methyltransferase RsmD [Malaciobacter molluscorum]
MKNSNNNVLTTHIISGKYKGKKLELPSLDVTRSSKSRLKESFFNVLQFDLIDKIFVEAFAGSGSIGLEAVSRGVKRAYFVEIDRNSYNILVKNCKSIDADRCQTMYGDTFIQLPSILNSLKNSNDEIVVYIDPPFDYRDGMEDVYEKSFDIVRKIENDNIYMITFEHVSSLSMPETLGKFQLKKTKKFGKSSLSYYIKEEK